MGCTPPRVVRMAVYRPTCTGLSVRASNGASGALRHDHKTVYVLEIFARSVLGLCAGSMSGGRFKPLRDEHDGRGGYGSGGGG